MIFPGTLVLAASVMLGRIPRWAIDPPLLLACLVVLADPCLRLKPEWTSPGRKRRLLLTAAAGSFSILIGFLIPAWANGGLMPGRLLNWLYLVFLSTLLAILLLLKPAWNLAAWNPEELPRWVRSAALAAMFVAMAALGNPRLAASDLAVRVPRWSAAKLEALRSLARGSEVFPQLPGYPHMYFDYDVNTNPADHPNVCVARYYRLRSVTSPRPPASPNGAALSGRLFRR